MRRAIVFLSCLALTLLMGVGSASAAPARKGPLPATLRAKAVALAGTPGSLMPIEGTLLDAKRKPLTGVPVVVSVAGSAQAELESLTGSGGTFEVYVPLPEQAPVGGTVDLQVTFHGTTEAAASSVTLPVRVEAANVPAEAELGQPADAPAPAATAPTEKGGSAAALPSSGSPLIDQLIVVAAGLLGVMVVLFGIGAGLRRRRS